MHTLVADISATGLLIKKDNKNIELNLTDALNLYNQLKSYLFRFEFNGYLLNEDYKEDLSSVYQGVLDKDYCRISPDLDIKDVDEFADDVRQTFSDDMFAEFTKLMKENEENALKKSLKNILKRCL